MLNGLFNKLSEFQKGIALIIAGSVLLFHTLGIIERGLDVIIVAGSLFMIGSGAIKVKAIKMAMGFLKKKEQRPPQ